MNLKVYINRMPDLEDGTTLYDWTIEDADAKGGDPVVAIMTGWCRSEEEVEDALAAVCKVLVFGEPLRRTI